MSEKRGGFNADRRRKADRTMRALIESLSPELPVLIAGPTASGKSALALAIAAAQGGVIVNADALQVYSNWEILTARPGRDDLALAEHALYGHVGPAQPYSVGHWLREVAALAGGPKRLIVTGGTGLYFSALTEGLAEIPPTPPDLRAEADRRRAAEGAAALLAELDPATAARIDRLNPMRVQRAWEVLRATGRGLVEWQDTTPAPLIGLDRAQALLVEAPPDWLNPRIERRFDLMLGLGALDEVRANLQGYDPALPSARAIGAPELVAHLRGEISLDAARGLAIISTRQFAKRQRTWFRTRMSSWRKLDIGTVSIPK
jgi:tRNA dimethylallyltransferase